MYDLVICTTDCSNFSGSIALLVKLCDQILTVLNQSRFNQINAHAKVYLNLTTVLISIIVITYLLNTDGIGVDWVNDKLYYHDTCSDHIGVLDLANNLYKTLATDTDVDHFRRYINIVVDPTERSDNNNNGMAIHESACCKIDQ